MKKKLRYCDECRQDRVHTVISNAGISTYVCDTCYPPSYAHDAHDAGIEGQNELRDELEKLPRSRLDNVLRCQRR